GRPVAPDWSQEMKQILALVVGIMSSASVARGGDMKITAVMATGPKDKPSKIFTPDVPKVHALFKTKGAQTGDKLRGVWIAEDVGDAAPANTKIDETTLTLEQEDFYGAFALSRPNKGWPVGKYKIDMYVGDELATTVTFTIKGGTSKKNAADDE